MELVGRTLLNANRTDRPEAFFGRLPRNCICAWLFNIKGRCYGNWIQPWKYIKL